MIYFSLIIIVYNIEIEKLNKCFVSLKKQFRDEIELIIIDDGSNEDVANYCDDFWQNCQFKVEVIHQLNQGASGARNTGINLAKGKWLLFIDGDDYVADDYIKTLYNVKNLDASVLYFAHSDVYENRTEDRTDKSINQELIKLDISNLDVMKKAFFYNSEALQKYPYMFGAVWNAMYRKDIIDDNKLIFDLKLRRGQDALFNLYYLNCCKSIYYLNKSLYNYNIYEGTAVTGFKKSPQMYLNFINAIDVYSINNENIRSAYYEKALDYTFEMIALHFFHRKYKKKLKTRINELKKILSTEQFYNILSYAAISNGSRKKKIALFLLRKKRYIEVYLVFKFFGKLT